MWSTALRPDGSGRDRYALHMSMIKPIATDEVISKIAPPARSAPRCARRARQTGLSLRLRRRASQPSPAKPVSVIAQVDGSGTLGAKPVVVALLILNADKKPDVNRVAFVSIAI